MAENSTVSEKTPKFKIIIGAFVFLIPFAVYLWTAPHTIYLGDSPEFITAAKVLGIPHPSGYPLYVILGNLFSFLPFDQLPFRIYLLSILASCAALVFVYLIAAEIISENWPELNKWQAYLFAASAAMLLAFSKIYWTSSYSAKPYAINTLFSIVTAWLVLRYWKQPARKLMFLIAFLLGLGISNHNMFALLVPAAVIAMLAGGPVAKKIFSEKRNAIIAALLFVLGLSLYAYLPIRSSMHPKLDWGRTGKSAHNFIYHIGRQQYNDIGTNFFADLKQNKIKFVASLALDIFAQYKYFVLLGAFGIIALVKNKKRELAFTSLLFISSSLALILIRSTKFSIGDSIYYSHHYQFAYAITAIWVAVGVAQVTAILQKHAGKFQIFSASLVAFLSFSLGISVFAQNYQHNNFHSFEFLENYSAAILNSMEKNAVLIVSVEGQSEDSYNFALLYQQLAKDNRNDVTIISYTTVFPNKYSGKLYAINNIENIEKRRQKLIAFVLENQEYKNKPIYTSFVPDLPEDVGQAVSNGLVYKLLPAARIAKAKDSEKNLQKPQFANFKFSESDRQLLINDYWGSDLLANFYYSQAGYYASIKNLRATQENFIKAIQLANEPTGSDATNFKVFRFRAMNSKD